MPIAMIATISTIEPPRRATIRSMTMVTRRAAA